MPAVLHVGPSETPGGMATVIHLLSDNPPDGWQSSILNSHSRKGVIGKLIAWRRAKKYLKEEATKFAVIHLHSASDWSFRRKCSLAKIAQAKGIPCIMHIHSGGFEKWSSGRNLSKKIGKSHLVYLTKDMADSLRGNLGEGAVIQNPVIIPDSIARARDSTNILLLGRKDDVKGHDFAIDIVRKLRSENPSYSLDMTGITHREEGIIGHGWVDEEKKERLLTQAGILLAPSQFEGQPMVILEACARELPVIASEISTPEGVTRVPLGDIEAWKEAILSGGGVGDVSQNDIDVVRELWKEFYSSIAANNASTE